MNQQLFTVFVQRIIASSAPLNRALVLHAYQNDNKCSLQMLPIEIIMIILDEPRYSSYVELMQELQWNKAVIQSLASSTRLFQTRISMSGKCRKTICPRCQYITCGNVKHTHDKDKLRTRKCSRCKRVTCGKCNAIIGDRCDFCVNKTMWWDGNIRFM